MSAAPMLWGRPRCSLRWRRRHRGSLGDGGDLATAAIAVAIAVAVAALAALAAISEQDLPNLLCMCTRYRTVLSAR